MTSIGDRMKKYEAVYNHTLTPNSPVFIRVDGRAFHTYTRGMKRPFDRILMTVMVNAAVETAREMQGFKLGYVQSDEATFMITDYDSHDMQGWFGYEVNKLVSISASLFTKYFNLGMHNDPPAVFDSRAFVIPESDAPNMFVWRQRDWERNSVQMLAQAHFSHKQLQGKKIPDMHDMLMLEKGINWATDLTPQEKNGTFILADRSTHHQKWNYDDIAGYLAGEQEQAAAA